MIYPVGSTVYSRSMRWGSDADQFYGGTSKGGYVVDMFDLPDAGTGELVCVYNVLQFHAVDDRMQPVQHLIPETDIDHAQSDDLINKANVTKLVKALHLYDSKHDAWKHLGTMLALSVAVNAKATA